MNPKKPQERSQIQLKILRCCNIKELIPISIPVHRILKYYIITFTDSEFTFFLLEKASGVEVRSKIKNEIYEII